MQIPYAVSFKKLVLSFKIVISLGLCGSLSCCTDNRFREKIQASPVTTIALLLPYEANDELTNELAKKLANSARLAVQDLDHLNLGLTVYPTSGDEERAVHAAIAAVGDGAEIIIGPMFSEETGAVKGALANRKIKIISLSNDPNVAGKNVFIMGTTLKTSAKRLVEFALSKGIQRLAVVGPQEEIGVNGVQAAQAAINENGAFLASTSLYPLNILGLQEAAPRIYNDLVESRTEAIIFTDTPTRGLGFITEQLIRLYEINNKKLPQFMGLTRWDLSKKFLEETSLYKGWFVIPDQRFKKRYQNRYETVFGTSPSDLSSLSYDAIALIGGVLQKSNNSSNPDKFQKKYFLDQNGFIGINGIFRFNSYGINERSLSIAEVTSGKFKIIDQAKNKF